MGMNSPIIPNIDQRMTFVRSIKRFPLDCKMTVYRGISVSLIYRRRLGVNFTRIVTLCHEEANKFC